MLKTYLVLPLASTAGNGTQPLTTLSQGLNFNARSDADSAKPTTASWLITPRGSRGAALLAMPAARRDKIWLARMMLDLCSEKRAGYIMKVAGTVSKLWS